MKGQSEFAEGFACIKRTYDLWKSFIRDRPGTRAEMLFGQYTRKIEWIANDLITCNHFPLEVREGIRKEWASDPFVTPSIIERLSLLTPDQREGIETVIEMLLSGEKMEIEIKATPIT